MAARRVLGLALIALLAGALAAPAARAGDREASPPSPHVLYRDGPTDRWLLAGEWRYRADPTDVGLAQQWWRGSDTTGWNPVHVPNAEDTGEFTDAADLGTVGWYQRDFTVPKQAFAAGVPASQRLWIVRFEEVNYRATVWLNGRLVGRHAGTSLPFEMVLGRLRAGVNRLVVRVDNRRGPGDLPPGRGGWWNYGGLLREVYLRAVAGVDLGQAQVTPHLPCPGCAATITETATVHNLTGAPQTVVLSGRYGSLPLAFGSATLAPGATWTPTASVVIAHPRLWSIDAPALYDATLTLSDSHGRRLGGYQTWSGIRSITVTRDGRLELNGRLLHLRGVEIREQDMVEGDALDPLHLRRLVGWARRLGATFIRADTPNPQVEEMADRDGLLIWSEITVSGLTSNSLLVDPGWLARAHEVLRENITDNANHPSILLWSIGNELDTPATLEETSYIAGAAALAHRLDPTRPVGMAVQDWPGVPCQPAYAPLQVIGVNEYFGWYDAGGGTTDDRDELSPFLDSVRACYPHQAIMVSEFGFDAGRSGPVEERGTYQFQADAAAFHLHVFATKPWLSAALYFDLNDAAVKASYTGSNPWPDPPWLEKGLVDRFGHLKPAFAVVASIYHHTRQIAPPPG